MHYRKKGSVTVFCALLIPVLGSFIMMLISKAREYVAVSEAKNAAELAIRSCFAEYNKTLFERFHILAIDSSYKGEDSGIRRILEHFENYLDNSITNSAILRTDVTWYCDCAGADNDYFIDSAVDYAVQSEMTQGDPFTEYVMGTLNNRCRAVNMAVRAGEAEYLIYGHEADEDNIGEASAEFEASGADSYDDFLRYRLSGVEQDILSERFSRLITEYMRSNGSPGFDPKTCVYGMEISADMQSFGKKEYVVTAEYEY